MDENNNMNPYGEQPQVQNPYGEQPQMQNPYGEQPQAQNPYGEQPQAQNPYGEQPQMQNPYGAYDAANNPFAAQGSAPAMNQGVNYGGQGMNPLPVMGPGNVPTQPPKNKKKVGKIVGISVACAALVALIVCAIIFVPRIFGNPKAKVEAALKENLKFSSVKNYMDDKVDFSSLQEKYLKEGGTVSSTITIDSVAGVDSLSGLGFSTSIVKDNASKKVSGESSFEYKGKSVMTAELFADEEKTYLAIPQLLDAYFSLPNKDILNAILSSPLNTQDMSAYAGMIPKFDIDYFATEMPTQSFELSDLELWEKATVKNAGNKKVSVNGKEIKAKKYEVTIKEEDLEQMLLDAVNKSLESLTSNAALSAYLEKTGLSADQIGQYKDQIASLVKGLVSGDFCFDIYVKDNLIVKFDCTGEMSLYGMKAKYTVYFDSYEGTSSGMIDLSVAGQSISLKYDMTASADELTGSVKLFGAGQDATLDFSVKRNGDVDHGEINFTFMGKTVTASWDGKLSNVVKGSAFTYEFSNLQVIADGESLFSMSGSVTIDTTKREIKAMDSSMKQYSLTEMTADEFQKAFADNKATEWLQNLMKDIPEIADLIGSMSGSGGLSIPTGEPVEIEDDEVLEDTTEN